MNIDYNIEDNLRTAVDYINTKIKSANPSIGLILGSGLGFFADHLENIEKINYDNIPGFMKSTVAGHQGKLVFGTLYGKSIVAMQGRMHFYEGYCMKQVTFPVRLMKRLGINTMIVTNAAGGVNKSFTPGDLMLITDHINGMGTNPCIGKMEKDAVSRFFDMTEAYDLEYRNIAKEVASEIGITLKEGTYYSTTGPSYETPAEVNMIRIVGGDAVGMSTVPEVIVAKEVGIRVCGVSCITNMASGVSDTPLTHEEVTDTANKVKSVFVKLIEGIIKKI